MSVAHFIQDSGTATIPGGVVDRPTISFKTENDNLNHHYNATMRQVQAGMGEDSHSLSTAKDSIAGSLSSTALTPSVAGFDAASSASNNAFLRPDTLPGALTPLLGETAAKQAAWLQRAELLKGEAKDTISAAGPDSLRHMDNISVQGNPYFINGTLQDTIRAVGVTVSGGATSFSDTISGTFHKFGHGETAPLAPYAPLPFKDSAGNPLYPKEGILPEGFGKDSFHPMDSDKSPLLGPHHKIDSKSSLIDLLHQVDHQVTIDLGKSSGVSSADELSKINSFSPDSLKNNLAHTTDEALGAKTDDSLVTLLDEEQKKRMATNINLGPFGGGH